MTESVPKAKKKVIELLLPHSFCGTLNMCCASLVLNHLVDVSEIFYFFLLGRGKGSPRGREDEGGRFFMENPRRGGVSPAGGGGGGEGPGGCLRGIWAGG